MKRVTRRKVGFVLILVGGAAIAVLINVASGFNPLTMLFVLLLLLIPGRIQSRYFRDLYKGRRRLDAGQPAAALVPFEHFLGQLRAEPWRKRLFWLSWSFYTSSLEAMTLNNIGNAHLSLGQLTEAEAALETALALDPLYPLPHYNRAVLSMVRGDRAGAERSLQEAVRLGYAATSIDAVIHRAQSLVARIEGRGA